MHQRSPRAKNELPERLLRLGDVSSRTRLSKSEIYRRIKAGTFPSSLKLGPRAVAWQESAIEEWIRQLVQDASAKPANYARA